MGKVEQWTLLFPICTFTFYFFSSNQISFSFAIYMVNLEQAGFKYFIGYANRF